MDEDYFWAAGRRKATPTPPPLSAHTTSPTNVTRDKDHIVDVVNNTIYFYSEVSRPKILELNKNINSLGTNLVNQTNLLKTKVPGNITFTLIALEEACLPAFLPLTPSKHQMCLFVRL